MKLLISAISALVSICLASVSLAAETQDCPDRKLVVSGTFSAVVTSVGLFIGGRWGEGTLTLSNGRVHRFTVSGAKLMEFGVATKILKGNVYNLSSIDDFPGTYFGIGGGLTVVAKGLGGMSIGNSRCVIINARVDKASGLQMSMPLAPGGVSIRFAH